MTFIKKFKNHKIHLIVFDQILSRLSKELNQATDDCVSSPFDMLLSKKDKNIYQREQYIMSSTVVQSLALVPHSEKVPGSIPGLGVSLCGVCMFSL